MSCKWSIWCAASVTIAWGIMMSPHHVPSHHYFEHVCQSVGVHRTLNHCTCNYECRMSIMYDLVDSCFTVVVSHCVVVMVCGKVYLGTAILL